MWRYHYEYKYVKMFNAKSAYVFKKTHTDADVAMKNVKYFMHDPVPTKKTMKISFNHL